MYSLIAFDGQVYGPVDVNTLIQWCREGRIVAGSHLIETMTGRSFIASDMMELRPHLGQSGPQAAHAPGPGPFASNPYAQPQNPYQQGAYQPNPYMAQGPYGQQYYGVGGPPKSKILAAVLCFLLGYFGIHRFYLGHNRSGVMMLLIGLFGAAFCPAAIAMLVWSTIDMIRILTGDLRDVNGVALV
jgi:TM2 domain-containing membrane protein YozV